MRSVIQSAWISFTMSGLAPWKTSKRHSAGLIFWSGYALPLSHSVKTVRHAVCALGGAHRLFKLQHGGYYETSPTLQKPKSTSIRQYSQAISLVKTIIDTATERDIEIVLTCCIIFIGLENLHGHYAESLRHVKAGTSFLVSLISRNQSIKALRDLPPFENVALESSNGGALSGRPPKFFDDFAQTLSRLGNDV